VHDRGNIGGTETLSFDGVFFWYGDFAKGDIFSRPVVANPASCAAYDDPAR